MEARIEGRSMDARRSLLFWGGTIALTAGTLLHLPMYVRAKEDGYQLAGMPFDGGMKLGMALILGGLVAAGIGLFQRAGPAASLLAPRVRVKALDDAKIKPVHVAVLLAVSLAVMVDIIKPVTLGFIVPGMALEYGLKSALNPGGTVPVALLPLAGILGTAIGSLVWGWLADRAGRRASILFAALIFIATSVCGVMPSFGWNLVMCFAMGLSAGGMLPIAFALLAETLPARNRGLLMILIGGDLAGAYFVASWLSSWLQPTFGWRILWLVGLPSGALLILLRRWIPESPRFLLAKGRTHEAQQVMQRFGVTVVEEQEADHDELAQEDRDLAAEALVESRFIQLLRRPFRGLSVGLGLYGLSFGLVQFGFLLWLPTNLRAIGFDTGTADGLVAKASLIGFPITFVVALLYAFWSSKKTMVLFAALTSAALAAFVALGDGVAAHPLLLQAFIVLIIMGVSTATSDLMPTYAAEVYPTRLRGRGTGYAAAAAKVGGVLGIGLVAASIAPPSIVGAALLGALPLGLAALALARFGVETRRRRLEEITAETLEGEHRFAVPEPVPIPQEANE